MTTNDMAQMLSKLTPGESARISHVILDHLERHMLPPWTVIDEILENVLGSAFDMLVTEDLDGRTVTVRRLEAPLTHGRRTYVSPDRRHYFRQAVDGLWEPLAEQAADYIGVCSMCRRPEYRSAPHNHPCE